MNKYSIILILGLMACEDTRVGHAYRVTCPLVESYIIDDVVNYDRSTEGTIYLRHKDRTVTIESPTCHVRQIITIPQQNTP